MSQPRVLRVIPSFYPYVTGPANQAYEVTRRLEPLGIRSEVWTTDHRAEDAPQRETFDGVAVTRLNESYGLMAYRYVRGVAALCDVDADIVHAHSYRNYLTTRAHRLARRRRLPYVVQPHGTLLMYRHILPAPAQWPYVAYDLATRKREVLDADAVILATEQERDEALEFGVAADRAHILPMGATIPQRPAPPGAAERIVALFVGRITPDRNVEQALRAFAIAAQSVARPMVLRIVGPGAVRSTLRTGDAYLQQMRRLAEDLKVADRTEFVGPLHGEALRDAYCRADVFVYPSAYENLGQTILEAAAAGLPLLVTRTGVARDLVRDGETGFFVPFGDATVTAERLAELAGDEALLRSMSARLINRVRRNYDWDTIVNGYAALYRSLLGGSTRQR